MKSQQFKFLCIALIALCLKSNAQQQPENRLQPLLTAFASQLQSDLERDRTGGSISFAVVQGDSMLHSGAFGFADVAAKRVADSASSYRIGSITKSFTAFLMMQLAEEGTIRLEDPIEQHLPEISQLKRYSNSNQITFRQLASHTGGIAREPRWLRATSGPIEEWEEKVLRSIPRTSLKAHPGVKFGYSNIGYAILGLALSRAAGRPYIELIQERIFNPLGMTSSFFTVTDDRASNLAHGMQSHSRNRKNKRALKGQKGRGYKVPNGGIYATPHDMAKFLSGLMGHTDLLNHDNLQLMRTSHAPEGYHGLGLFLFKDDEISVVCHDGVVAGYNCVFVIETTSGLGLVLMRSYNRGSTNLYDASFGLIRKMKKSIAAG
jgi:CubicO group peptidase (beta-lactamase class C family)